MVCLNAWSTDSVAKYCYVFVYFRPYLFHASHVIYVINASCDRLIHLTREGLRCRYTCIANDMPIRVFTMHDSQQFKIFAWRARSWIE